MRKSVGIALCLIPLGVCVASAAPSFLIRGDVQIGNFDARRGSTLGGAVAAFGQPDTRAFNDFVDVCTTTWRAIGLRIVFVNFAGDDPCGNTTGFFARATMGLPGAWRTARGLRIGASVQLLRALYPRATFHGPVAGWWLIAGSHFVSGGSRQPYPSLVVHVHDGRVASFMLRIRAAAR